jgi:hypothetical protein
MAHYKAVMPAPPDIDLPYWERLLSSLLERVYRTYALLADPLAFQVRQFWSMFPCLLGSYHSLALAFHLQPLLALKLDQMQQDAAESEGGERIDAVLTSGGADPILTGSHLPTLAAASFAIDSRLFVSFLCAPVHDEPVQIDLPIGGVLIAKPADAESRHRARVRMEQRVLDVLLQVLKRRGELPLMPPSFHWTHTYVPPPGLRNASPAVIAEENERKLVAISGNLSALSLPALAQGRIGFRTFRALMLQASAILALVLHSYLY